MACPSHREHTETHTRAAPLVSKYNWSYIQNAISLHSNWTIIFDTCYFRTVRTILQTELADL